MTVSMTTNAIPIIVKLKIFHFFLNEEFSTANTLTCLTATFVGDEIYWR